jgi:type IV secretory pathway TraG/TraD family ATPase VirD4
MENLENLLETPRRAAVYGHFANRFLTQPDEQLGGVRETIGNYLQYFLTPEVAEVFCTGESTFDFSTIDQGKIILTTMPQKFQTERRYVNTLLKLLYYNHALRRFDKAKADRAQNNLLILWADEAQRFMTASEDGTSDYNCVDVIREAGATVVAAAQSTTSLVPPLGNDKAKVLTLNLRNRLIFRAADEADAVQAADFIGKKRVVKRSWGFSAGRRNVNYSETEEHKIKPHKLRNLRDHECVLVHCERGFRRVTLPPLESDGTTAKWFSVWRSIF